MEMEFREATPADAEAIQCVARAAWHAAYLKTGAKPHPQGSPGVRLHRTHK